MARPFPNLHRFLRELRRRNVYKVGAAYLVAAFVALQLAGLAAGAFGFPAWFEPMVWIVAGLGLPLALVVAYAFEVTPKGVRRTPVDGPGPEAPAGRIRIPLEILVGLALAAAIGGGGWYLLADDGESRVVGEGTVAVLPFQVSGAGTNPWREGMVTMLSTALDGPANLRAIPDQTVLAAWEEAAHSGQIGVAGSPLAIARRIGAEFAVIGQAAAMGDALLLSADVYRTSSGERLGQAEIRGSPDGVTALADSLSRRVLGILLEEGGGELPRVDLSRVTTGSRAALLAFLEGESLFRDGDFQEAVAAYREAIRADSTFALAYTRMSNAAGWGSVERVQEPLRRAHALSDRLPHRQRRLIQAIYNWVHTGDRMAAADTLRTLSRAYPDDPAVWYNLGEVIWHGQVPRGWPEAEDAFRRAVDLDPVVAAYHHHLVDLAFSLHRDEDLAARRIEAHPGREDRKRLFRIALDLVFGSPEARRTALRRVERVPIPNDWAVWLMLRHPRDGKTEDRVLRVLLDREDLGDRGDSDPLLHSRFGLVLNGLEHGRIGRAVADAERLDLHPGLTSCYLAGLVAVGVAVPDSIAAEYLEPSNLGPEPSLRRLKCTGTFLIDRGREDELSTLEPRFHDAPVAEIWPTVGLDRSPQAALDLLEGYRAWRGGDLEEAAGRLSTTSPWDWWAGTGAIWRGDFALERGRPETAEGWYLAAWWHPVAHERLGRLNEETGEPEAAIAAYRRYIAGWEDADEALQPRMEGARERLRALTAGR